MFAKVKYLADDKVAIVPISDIKDFSPKNPKDFNKSQKYKALWPLKEVAKKDKMPRKFYDAAILRLLDKPYEEQGKRLAAPPKRHMVTDSEECGDLEAEIETDTNPSETEEDTSAISNLIKTLMKRTNKKRKRNSDRLEDNSSAKDSAGEEDDYAEIGLLKKKCWGLEKRVEELESMLEEQERKNKELDEETKQLRYLNRQIQEKFCQLETSPSPAQQSSSMETILGQSIQKEKLTLLELSKDNNEFTLDCLKLFYSPTEIANRSYSGKKCNRKPGFAPKQAISPQKVAVIKTLFKKKLERENCSSDVIALEVKGLPRRITAAINNTQKSIKARKSKLGDDEEEEDIIPSSQDADETDIIPSSQDADETCLF